MLYHRVGISLNILQVHTNLQGIGAERQQQLSGIDYQLQNQCQVNLHVPNCLTAKQPLTHAQIW